MQRVWRVGRPATPNGPGGRQSRRGRATAFEPARLVSKADTRKGFPRRQMRPLQKAGRAWWPASGIRIRFTHGDRFPPPPLSSRPAGEPARPEPAPDAIPASRRRRDALAAGASRRRVRGPAGAASGPWPQVSSGNGTSPSSRGGPASRHLRQRCHGSGLIPQATPGSPGRFLRSVHCSRFSCIGKAPAGRFGPRLAVEKRLAASAA
jgi:hypothetical protein